MFQNVSKGRVVLTFKDNQANKINLPGVGNYSPNFMASHTEDTNG